MAEKQLVQDYSDGFKPGLSVGSSPLNDYSFTDKLDFEETFEGVPGRTILFGEMRARKKRYVDTANGIWLGVDQDGKAKLNIGDDNDFLKYDGTNLILSANASVLFTASGNTAATISTSYNGGTDVGTFTIAGAGGTIGLQIESNIGAGTTGTVTTGALSMTGFASTVVGVFTGQFRVTDIVGAKTSTAPASGGTYYYRVGNSTDFGIYAGSGVPTISASKGSLYLRTDGSGTTDRAYINTDGSTTWTAITTVA